MADVTITAGTVSHALSATTPDDPTAEIQPQHWNSRHAATMILAAANAVGLFSNANGISFGTSAGPAITASYTQSTHDHPYRNSTDAVGLNTALTANGVAWTVNSSGISLNVPAFLTTAALSNHSHGNPQLNLTNLSGTTASNSAGFTLSLSANAPGGGAFSAGVSNGGNTVGDTGITGTRLVFAGGNNITLSQVTDANGATITVSGANAGGAQTGISGVVVSDTTYTSGTVSFSNQANITIGSSVDGATQYIRLSGNPAQTVQTQNFIAAIVSGGNGDGTYTSGTLSFKAGNNITLSTGAGVMSIHGVASQTVQTQNFVAIIGSGANGNGTFTSGTLSLKEGNNITLSTGANVISIHGVASQTVQTQNLHAAIVSGANGNLTQTSGTLSVKAGNNITLSTGANVYSIHGVAAQTEQTQNMVVIIGSGANGNGTFSSGTLSIKAGNNVTLSTGANVISIHAPSPGAAAEANALELLGANTAGNTTVSGSTLGFSGVNLTLSGTQDSRLVISAPATSSLVGTNGISISTNGSTISVMGAVLSGYAPYDEGVKVAGQQGQGTWHIQPLQVPSFQHDRVGFEVVWSNSSNSTGSATISHWIGLYTQNASTLSLLASTSTTNALTFSGTVGNFSLQHGNRLLTIPWTRTLTEGNYWIGIANRTTTGGGNGSFSQMLVSDVNSNFSGIFGAASNATNQRRLGLGVYSASSSSVPGSIAFSQINGTASLAQRQPSILWASGTA